MSSSKCPICGKNGKESFNLFLCSNPRCENYDKDIVMELLKDSMKKRKNKRDSKNKAINKEMSIGEDYLGDFGWNSMFAPSIFYPFYYEGDNNEI